MSILDKLTLAFNTQVVVLDRRGSKLWPVTHLCAYFRRSVSGGTASRAKTSVPHVLIAQEGCEALVASSPRMAAVQGWSVCSTDRQIIKTTSLQQMSKLHICVSPHAATLIRYLETCQVPMDEATLFKSNLLGTPCHKHNG